MEFSEKNVKRLKRCLSHIIPKEESIIEFATANLSIAPINSIGIKKFIPFHQAGILCIVANRKAKCLFLQLYEITAFKKVFEIELYSNIKDGYKRLKDRFFTIEFPGFFLGISFPEFIKESPEKDLGISLMEKSLFSISEFLNINFEEYIYYSFFDKEEFHIKKKKEQRDKEKKKDEFIPLNEVIIIEPDIGRKEEKEDLEKLDKMRKYFENEITVTESEDSKVYKLIEFHVLRVQMKQVKKIFKKNFDRFIGTKDIYLENIKGHPHSRFMVDEQDDNDDNEMKKEKYVEFDPNDFMEVNQVPNWFAIHNKNNVEMLDKEKDQKILKVTAIDRSNSNG